MNEHHVKRSTLRIAIILLLCLALLPGAAGAEKPSLDGAAPKVAEVEKAIAEAGYDWTTRDYGRAFSFGTLTKGHDADTPLLSGGNLRLLASIDWRDNGGNWVSPIKDQANCGSCWAFAGVGAVESLYAIQHATPGTFLDLCEQILVSCASANYGCAGGYMDETAQFLRDYGTAYESCYPYTASNGNCGNACADWQSSAIQISGYQAVAQTVTALKTALQDGPVQVAFDVYGDFDNYSSGVYERTSDSFEGGHAVLAVGYADTPGQYGGGYFIVKNSWGRSWGESGYFRIGYSQVTDRVDFGVDAYRYTMGGDPDDPPPPPPDNSDDYEPDGTAEQASTLVPGEQQTHSISPAADIDWATFALTQAGDVVIETAGVPNGDTRMWLYDESMNELANNDDISRIMGNYYSRISESLDPGTYYVKIDCYYSDEEIATYTLDLTHTSEPSTGRYLPVGWSLVSLPYAPEDTDPGEVLASIVGKYVFVYSHNGCTNQWGVYVPGLPYFSNLDILDATTPFWILMTEAGTLALDGPSPGTTQQSLCAGWNFVSYPSHATLPVGEAFASIDGLYSSVYSYDATAENPWLVFSPSVPAWANRLSHCEPGHGYWVKVNTACTLTISDQVALPAGKAQAPLQPRARGTAPMSPWRNEWLRAPQEGLAELDARMGEALRAEGIAFELPPMPPDPDDIRLEPAPAPRPVR